MALEIERKYLVDSSAYRQMASHHAVICQGYLNRDPNKTVRVRILDDKGFITVKGITRDAVREEYEYAIPLEDARAMMALCGGDILEKTRWYVPFGGMTWEVDEFHGALEGLTVAEIELPAADAVIGELPPFVGLEVTGDPRYYNSSLTGASQAP